MSIHKFMNTLIRKSKKMKTTFQRCPRWGVLALNIRTDTTATHQWRRDVVCRPGQTSVFAAPANQTTVFLGFRTSGVNQLLASPPLRSLYIPSTSLFCPFLSSYSLSLPLITRSLKLSWKWKVWGAVSSLSGVWGGAPAEIEFGVF